MLARQSVEALLARRPENHLWKTSKRTESVGYTRIRVFVNMGPESLVGVET
jgi:hypothetical protein